MCKIKLIILCIMTSSCLASNLSCEYNEKYTKDSYEDMRAFVINEGWIPDVASAKKERERIESPLVSEREFLDQGIFEVAACSGTGEGNCTFLFKRDGKKLRIITYDIPAYVKYVEVCEIKNVG